MVWSQSMSEGDGTRADWRALRKNSLGIVPFVIENREVSSVNMEMYFSKCDPWIPDIKIIWSELGAY